MTRPSFAIIEETAKIYCLRSLAHIRLASSRSGKKMTILAVFLDIGLHPVQNNHRKKCIWLDEYADFSIFVPVRYRRNLTGCLTYRTRTICNPETVNEELEYTREYKWSSG